MDRREAILVRLVAIAEGIPGIATVGRNRANIDDFDRPAIQILDGGEEADDKDPQGRSGSSTRRIAMSPELYVVLAGKPEELGPELNKFRALLVKAITEDAELEAICGTNGYVRYGGMATGLSRELGIVAEMGLAFSFGYPLRPSEL